MAETKTGEELITAHEAAEVQKVSSQVAAIREQALGLEVRNAAEAQTAGEFLGALKTVQKEAEETRKFLVQPLNDHVKAINRRFKPNAEALEQAERAIKGKVLSYNRVQEDLRRAEQARLDAQAAEEERLRQEEAREREAEAERQRVAAETAAREAAEAAAAAERERLAALEREVGSRRDRISKLGEEALKRLAASGGDDAALAEEELVARERHREAQAAAERAAAAAEQARQAQEAAAAEVEAAPVQVATSGPVHLAGTASRKRWTFEVTDVGALPDWALMPNEPEIRRRVRAGERDVPGLRIYQEDELAVRAR